MRNPDHKPRAAYCTGCGVIFPKMHLMINHRRNYRCGGRFNPFIESYLWEVAKTLQQRYDTTNDPEAYRQSRANLIKVVMLRRRRRESQSQTATR